jgi:hypothetical protein
MGFLIFVSKGHLHRITKLYVSNGPWPLPFPITENINFVEDHPRNTPAKFGSNWPSGFREEA